MLSWLLPSPATTWWYCPGELAPPLTQPAREMALLVWMWEGWWADQLSHHVAWIQNFGSAHPNIYPTFEQLEHRTIVIGSPQLRAAAGYQRVSRRVLYGWCSRSQEVLN